ncbi:methylmalonyl-CoA carboxyltransferase [Desulfuribacillus stibiiarsenatis]|uniref:Methylmalonyl-CoA carboxyltransferase n=1 Tax=Desulfuribacillus stibiiarsenatis TaxID=1390249 RepID=A0A1E5L6E4_9FIRM|nr:acyl-CoA carboxylase subunit beta [Desulfuribacillus stibiiarsenatis]OEH85686.1 methylmalonyl-CoA carboxyltransferase [Desulfuribacillus stibiiarsenatis]
MDKMREKIRILCDQDSFEEINAFVTSRMSQGVYKQNSMGDGVITGYATIANRKVFIYGQDFTFCGGSLGEMHGKKIAHLYELAEKCGSPVIGLIHSGGARINEGVLALDSYGHIFRKNVELSGKIPQISIILGPCAGGAVYSPALTDFVCMVENQSQMFITGPKVIEVISGEKIIANDLGGTNIHANSSGVCHLVRESEEEMFHSIQQLLEYIPQNHQEYPRNIEYIGELYNEMLEACIPYEKNKTYDMRNIVLELMDNHRFFEIQATYAKNIMIGFGRVGGHTIAIVANQPKYRAGGIDIDASDKAARFIRFCDCFNIPILTIIDVPGFIPGQQQEALGIIRHGAKLLYAYAEATVPKISLVVRKAYGGAYVALNSKSIGADMVFAWPTAEISVMGPQGLQAIMKDTKNSPDSDPMIAASYGLIDEIINPNETRRKLKSALMCLQTKSNPQKHSKKHGNIPL